jgi:hypothetical protein
VAEAVALSLTANVEGTWPSCCATITACILG